MQQLQPRSRHLQPAQQGRRSMTVIAQRAEFIRKGKRENA
jgi:hypothetical protein